jgi:hypothetical protein
MHLYMRLLPAARLNLLQHRFASTSEGGISVSDVTFRCAREEARLPGAAADGWLRGGTRAMAAGIICPPELIAGLQCPRNRFGDVTPDERFAKHIQNPCGLGALAQLWPAVTAHEY